MAKSNITFEYVPFDKLIFMSDNPRSRTDEGFRKMVNDIKADPSFYENRPTLVNNVDGKYYVYAGDLRAHAAHYGLKWPEVPCNIEIGVEEYVMRRRAILDNTHREQWDNEKLGEWEFDSEELESMGVDIPEFYGIDDDGVSETFSLPSGSKDNFQQITLTLSSEQAEVIRNAIDSVKKTDEFKYMETFGNENSNGNATYLVFSQWGKQKI